MPDYTVIIEEDITATTVTIEETVTDVVLGTTVAQETVVIVDNAQGPQGTQGIQGIQGITGNGISSIARTSGTGAAGTTDTFTITYTSGSTTTFTVYNGTNGTNGTNGRGITSITRTSGTGAAGTTDTYTITYSDATTSTFNVVNGANGPSGVVNVTDPITNSGTSTSAQLGLAAAGTAGIYTKVTTDSFGRVTSGTTLATTDVPTLNQNTTGNAATATNLASSTTTLASTVTASSLTSFGTDPTANTQAVDNNSTKIATTAFVLGQAAGTAPVMNGTAAVGTSTRYARQDHVHGSDTSKLSLTGGTMSGSLAMGSNPITGATSLQATGLTGATQNPIRLVGATTAGAPTTGTYAVGDIIVDNTATIWICITAGTPGTWSPNIQSSVQTRSATATAVAGEQTIFTGSTAGQTITLPANPQNGSIYQIKNLSSNVVYINGGTNSLSVSGQVYPPYFTATTAVSNTLTVVSSYSNLVTGMALTSTYVPTGTTISTINSGTNIIMSASATTAASLQQIKVLVTIPTNAAYSFVYNSSGTTWYLIDTTDLAQMANILPVAKGGTGTNGTATGSGGVVLKNAPSLDGPVTVATATTTTVPLKVQTTATSATANIFEVRNTVVNPTDPVFRVGPDGTIESEADVVVGLNLASSLGAFYVSAVGDATFAGDLTVNGVGTTIENLQAAAIDALSLTLAGDVIANAVTTSSDIVAGGILTASYNDYGSILNGGVLPFDTYNVIKMTPGSTGTSTLTASVPAAGTVCNLIITSNVSVSSRVISFGSSTFRTTGTLSTVGSGSVVRTYSISFVSDGTKLTEIARTGLMTT
jgi:hypothetical protein